MQVKTDTLRWQFSKTSFMLAFVQWWPISTYSIPLYCCKIFFVSNLKQQYCKHFANFNNFLIDCLVYSLLQGNSSHTCTKHKPNGKLIVKLLNHPDTWSWLCYTHHKDYNLHSKKRPNILYAFGVWEEDLNPCFQPSSF